MKKAYPLEIVNGKIKEGYLSVEYAQKTIIAPIDFSFKNQYDESVLFLKSFISSYLLSKGNIVLDFSQCKRGSISTFVQLSILLKELNLALRRFNSGCMYKNYKDVKILPSKDIKILKYLAALNLFNGKELENLDKCDLFLPLKLQRGRQNGVYSENKKGVVGKRMVEFVNEALRANSYELNKKGQSVLRGLIDGVLSNAEDHSLKYSEWFVDGIAFMEKQFGTDVVELNFAILNYGDSMYEGFEKTKEQNIILQNNKQELESRIIELQKGNPYSPSTIRKNIKYAVIDKGLYELLQDEGNRQVLIKSLTDSLDK